MASQIVPLRTVRIIDWLLRLFTTAGPDISYRVVLGGENRRYLKLPAGAMGPFKAPLLSGRGWKATDDPEAKATYTRSNRENNARA